MNPEVKKKWLEALRSGEYLQTQGQLRDISDGGFCCLGVLCDLHSKETDEGKWIGELYQDGKYEEYGILTHRVCEWAGLTGRDPELGLATITDLNDSECLSFDEIADEIEEHL